MNNKKHLNVLSSSWIDTPLGPMLAIANDACLLLLEFEGRRGLEREIERLRIKMKAEIIPGKTAPVCSIEKELHSYFEGTLVDFKTKFYTMGTDFQKQVWDELQKTPSGVTRSYLDVAKKIGKPLAVRAVAQANGANQLAIIIPCHRIINSNGELGGYAGGLSHKEWLINHEKAIL